MRINSSNDQETSPLQIAMQIVNLIATDSISELAGFIHPEEGVQFSPYSYFEHAGDVTIRAESLVSEWNDHETRVWGSYDGSDELIELTTKTFFERFVYDRDYVKAPVVLIDEIAQHSATRVNIHEFFPGSVFVEFHIPGTESYGGMDWASLRIVLVQNEHGGWWLRAIGHGQWTS